MHENKNTVGIYLQLILVSLRGGVLGGFSSAVSIKCSGSSIPLPSFSQISIHCFPFHKRSHADHRLQPKSSDHQSQHLTTHSVAQRHAARGTRNNDNQTTALTQSLPLCVPRVGSPKKGHRRLGFPASEIHCSPARRIAHGYYKKANKQAVSQMTIISVTLVVGIKSTLS